jgi:hypothetical protein
MRFLPDARDEPLAFALAMRGTARFTFHLPASGESIHLAELPAYFV